jgi:hypothetical protein
VQSPFLVLSAQHYLVNFPPSWVLLSQALLGRDFLESLNDGKESKHSLRSTKSTLSIQISS